MLRIEPGKEVKSKVVQFLTWSETSRRTRVKRTHKRYVCHRTHDLHKPLEARELCMREATMSKVSAKFQRMICDLHPRPESLLPLRIVNEHCGIVWYLFPHAVALWIVSSWWKQSWGQVMHPGLLHDSIAKNPTIREEEHVLDACCPQRLELLAPKKQFEWYVL